MWKSWGSPQKPSAAQPARVESIHPNRPYSAHLASELVAQRAAGVNFMVLHRVGLQGGAGNGPVLRVGVRA